jgi:hypothetical protein
MNFLSSSVLDVIMSLRSCASPTPTRAGFNRQRRGRSIREREKNLTLKKKKANGTG